MAQLKWKVGGARVSAPTSGTLGIAQDRGPLTLLEAPQFVADLSSNLPSSKIFK